MVTPVDHTTGCQCKQPHCCRTNPLLLAGFMAGWIFSALLGGVMLGIALQSHY